MSTLTETDIARVYKIWNWCCESYSKIGHILRFPQATDPQKTYQWRYITHLAGKLEEWEFDDATSKTFIDHVASYVKDKNLLRKGLSAFCQDNILQVCYNRFEASIAKSDLFIHSLAASATFLQKNTINDSILAGLMGRKTPDSMFNIVTWYEIGKLSKYYLALSKSCTIAMASIAKIDKDQRDMLPKQSELYILRAKCISDRINGLKSKQVLGSDWR